MTTTAVVEVGLGPPVVGTGVYRLQHVQHVPSNVGVMLGGHWIGSGPSPQIAQQTWVGGSAWTLVGAAITPMERPRANKTCLGCICALGRRQRMLGSRRRESHTYAWYENIALFLSTHL